MGKNILWKNWFGIVISFLVVVLPFLGIQRSLKSIIFAVFGFSLILTFFSLANDYYNLNQQISGKKPDDDRGIKQNELR